MKVTHSIRGRAKKVNTDELGDLGLNHEEEDAIVAFLKTLSDGYVVPEEPKKEKQARLRKTSFQ